MLTLSFTFPAGRYHATPWGRHVNEADVAWPPDLWRLTRAFIATWYRKLNPEQYPRERLVELLTTLAGEAPHYALPEAVHFHTRHFMPAPVKRTLIFDAFAQVGREAELIAHWPNTTLETQQTALLDALLNAIGYLGRAESWVEARRLEAWAGECDCYPSEQAMNPETGEVGDLAPLWLPQTPAGYAEVNAELREAALARERADIHRKRAQALAEGKTGKSHDPAKAKLPAVLAATLPLDWLDALSLDTGELQSAGWSSPPAARQLYYLRRKNALRFMAATPAKARSRQSGSVTTARYALYAKPLPRITDAVRVGETLRMALMGRARRLFGDAIPPSLSGHGLPEGNRHGHAFFLSEANPDGRVGHLIVHAPEGFDAQAQSTLAELKSIHTREGAEWRLLLEGMGEVGDFPASKLLQSATVWRSATPYLHPWHRKKGFGVEEQVARECGLRGLPAPVAVEWLEDGRLRPLDFHRFRSRRGLSQPDRQGCFLQLTFASPVAGPLALGFGCHFGLGVFQPEKACQE
ncbi:MAG: type I-U CRISPR-associated protein Cas5/Cas6 [Betaproteobacteria bacterium]|nr:type I-U CRISPR-associated protein Cas5/Cas6 [Betaproteobacteria bacterium]